MQPLAVYWLGLTMLLFGYFLFTNQNVRLIIFLSFTWFREGVSLSKQGPNLFTQSIDTPFVTISMFIPKIGCHKSLGHPKFREKIEIPHPCFFSFQEAFYMAECGSRRPFTIPIAVIKSLDRILWSRARDVALLFIERLRKFLVYALESSHEF